MAFAAFCTPEYLLPKKFDGYVKLIDKKEIVPEGGTSSMAMFIAADGTSISIFAMRFLCIETKEKITITIPYNWDRDTWMVGNMKLAKTISPDILRSIISVISNQPHL